MTIKVDDNWLMESHREGGYDLIRVKTGKSGKVKDKETFNTVGFNMTFESCLKRIVQTNVGEIVNTVDLKGYIDLFRNEVSRIKAIVDGVV